MAYKGAWDRSLVVVPEGDDLQRVLGTLTLRIRRTPEEVWVHGRQFPDAMDADDGNWLRVTAHCGGTGASVFVAGSIIQVPDILHWGRQCARLLDGEAKAAALDPLEPALSAIIDSADRHGHFRLLVEITPDHLRQKHVFEFEIDQSHLPGLIRQCDSIACEYPPR